jgi:hypothetical protein
MEVPPPPSKKRRGKPIEQIEAAKNIQHSSVVMKFTSALRKYTLPEDAHKALVIDHFRMIMEEVVTRISRIAFEAPLLTNFYLLTCLTNGVELPKIDQSFFYSCCALVAGSSKIRNQMLQEVRN